jgi:hypothetical protein
LYLRNSNKAADKRGIFPGDSSLNLQNLSEPGVFSWCQSPNSGDHKKSACQGAFSQGLPDQATQQHPTNQPPFFGRLPGFFLLRVAEPRSRLTF